jgi:hypothetical protein
VRSHVPKPQQTVLIGDDAHLLAELSAILGRKRTYLPVLDGPRIHRPDLDQEVIRRNNAVALIQPERILFAGLPASTCDLFAPYFPDAQRVSSASEVSDDFPSAQARPTLTWGKNRVGLGLLHALKNRQRLAFEDTESPSGGFALDSRHVVLCEEGDEQAQVVAANYAFSIDAGLALIPSFPTDEADALLEDLYNLGFDPAVSAATFLPAFRERLRSHVGALRLTHNATITFVTAKLPWGFAFPEFSSTHLFLYPDLGITVVNAIVAEQADSPGIRTAVVVDPASVDAKEVEAALVRLTENGVVSKSLRSRNATVHQVANTIRLFPYDLLLISTHCGDATGWRWTYEFTDSEQLPRRLVVDIAVGAEIKRRDEDVRVTEFIRFVSLDGVDWSDREAKRALHVGTAIHDFLSMRREHSLEPVSREVVPRVHSSMALRMSDGDYIALPEALASENSPIVINNACASWHRLAGDFMFAGARCYVGTLFSVVDAEAQAVLEQLFGKSYDQELAVGLRRAQDNVYGDGTRRPYVMCGCHFQRLLTHQRGTLAYVVHKLQKAHLDWRMRLRELSAAGDSTAKTVAGFLDFLQSELTMIQQASKRRNDGSWVARVRSDM